MEHSLSLVVPVYNEEENLKNLIKDIEQYFASFTQEYEVIFIDDGSTDASGHIIKEVEEQNIRLLKHQVNKGYGEALKTGFESAEKDLIAYIDGDGQFDIEDLDDLLEVLPENDIVIGEREKRMDGFDRILIGQAFNSIIRNVLGISVSDVDCGLKLFNRDVLDEVELTTKRTVDAELIAKAYHIGFDIEQVKVRHYEREAGDSEASGLIGVRPGLVITSLKEIVQIRREIKYER